MLPSDMQRQAQTGLAWTGKTILCMLFVGILCLGIGVNVYSAARKVGLSPSAAEQLPGYGFFFGLALGLGIRTIERVRAIVTLVAAGVVTGAVFWCIGAVLGASLDMLRHDSDLVSRIPPIAFWLGFVALPIYIYVARRRDALRAIEK